ncbi:MAG: alpha-beta hydrolase superfamily lysophospholipase [Pseudohongiellaceae bacterium]|jgi:alpha-beta hydrolase superfamily lysophospholipase
MFTRADADSIRGRLGEPFAPNSSLPDGLFSDYFSFYGFGLLDSFHRARHYAGKVPVGSNQVVVQHFQSAAASASGTVFLLHGYLDHAGLYKHIIDYCLKRNFKVVIFDQIGHGLSTGEPASIDSFDSYAQALRQVLQQALKADLPRPWNVVGQSTGGAVILDSLQKHYREITDEMASYVLLAPLLRPFAWKKSRVLFAMSKPFIASTKRAFSQNSHDEEFLRFLKQDDPLQSKRLKRDWIVAMIHYQRDFAAASPSAVPLKIIQGTGDTTVDWQFNIDQIQAKFPNAVIHLIEQARHHLVNESPLYRDQAFALLDGFLIES